MASLVKEIQLPSKPAWLNNNLHYEVITGSQAYGCATPESDTDVQGFCTPPKDMIFPHLAGEIPGFGTKAPRFEQWLIHDPMDATIFNIIKFFDLILNCNPNIIDILFVPDRCVIHCTNVGQIVRDKRHLFLSKKAWHTFKGYAYSQEKRIRDESNKPKGKRRAIIEQYGYDVKFAYHIVRLMGEVRQILEEHNLDLERDRETYKTIRRGEWTLDQLHTWFQDQMTSLEPIYNTSTLRYAVDEPTVKEILLNCLEEHYGDLSTVVVKPSRERALMNEIQNILERYR